MKWDYGRRSVTARLPFGASWLAPVDATVSAGDLIARGTVYRATRRIAAARALGCRPQEVRALLRVGVGESVRAGAVLARTGRRFARAIVARHDGRVVHVGADGDLHLGTVRHDWEMRALLDGVITRADAHAIVIEGEAWALEGLAGFGPSAAGALAMLVDRNDEDLSPAKLDVRLAGRIVVGGAEASGEALTRAHAVGVQGIVAPAASFRALAPIYGDAVGAWGFPTLDDLPTLLVLSAYGTAALPAPAFQALRALDGARAALDVAAARLLVFAPRGASEPFEVAPAELAPDLSGARG